MTATYDLIASNVLTTSASSVTFSSIPATYRDLVLVVEFTEGSSGSVGVQAEVNDDTGANYPYVRMVGDGSTATSATSTTEYFAFTPARSVFGQSFLGILQIMDYSATDKHKTGLIRSNLSGEAVLAVAQRWASTSAINKIKIFTASNTYPAGSSFYLYGIVS